MDSSAENHQSEAFSSPAVYFFDTEPDPQTPIDGTPQPKRSKLNTLGCIVGWIARLIVCFLCIFIGFPILIITFYMGFTVMLLPERPSLQLDSLSVSNFGISTSTITSQFNASLTVRNPNKRLTLHFDRIDSPLSYKQTFLCNGTADAFEVKPNDETGVAVTFTISRMQLEDEVLDEMHGDKKRGVIVFDFAMAFQGSVDLFWPIRKPVIMNALCLDLNMRLDASKGTGILSGTPKNCLWLL